MERETNNRLAERIGELAAQLAVVETQQRNTAERAAEDRAEVNQSIAAVKADIADVKKSVGESTRTIQSAVDQIKGGRRVLAALWVVGGLVGTIFAWATGLLKALGGVLVR